MTAVALNRKNVAFLGLGVMGSPMAQNMVKSGFSVKGWNRTQTGRPLVTQACSQGVAVVPTIAEAVGDVSLIAICVGDVPDVEQVLFGEGGVAQNACAGSIIIDFSTIGPKAAKDFAARLQEHSLHYVDAPVSGGDVGAQNGTLTIMVGGGEPDFEQCLPAFNAVGQSITYCGPSGSGQAVKLCNQVLCAIHTMALSETLSVARTLEVDPQKVIDVCSSGAAGSWILSNLGPKMIQDDFAPGFMIKHMLKDLRLVNENAEDVLLPAFSQSMKNFSDVAQSVSDGLGTQAMIKAYRPSTQDRDDIEKRSTAA